MKVKITRQMKTGERRLHLIANLLDSDFFPERRFDMLYWAATPTIWEYWRPVLSKARKFFRKALLEKGYTKTDATTSLMELPIENVCGTTACAMGHATAIPELYDAGLRLTILNHELRKRAVGSADITLIYKDRTYTNNITEISRALFGVEPERSNDMFGGVRRTPQEEAEVIRQTIDEINKGEGFAKTRV